MGLRGMENFDVVGDPDEFLMTDQPTKIDETIIGAGANAASNMMSANASNNISRQGPGVVAPRKNKTSQPETATQGMRRVAQPTNRNVNKSTGKNK